LEVLVLGSAAGGGVPQWNCRCAVCALAWAGDRRVMPRTQSSIAVSADGQQWLLVNASPDIREQLAAAPRLRPRHGLRDSPILAVLVSNADVDHVAGLLGLRERQAFTLYGTQDTLALLAANPIFSVLDEALVRRQTVALSSRFEPLPGLTAELFAVPGKAPLWMEGPQPDVGRETGGTVGVLIEANGRRLAYVPGCAGPSDLLARRLEDVDLLLFDGTLYRDDEMITAGLGSKTGRRMGHMPMAGPDGSIAALAASSARRRVFIHINNTNPALIEGSPERSAVEAAGWTLAHDGLAFSL
jgi:pyrroloquinoline quinone biosynthesis protein B